MGARAILRKASDRNTCLIMESKLDDKDPSDKIQETFETFVMSDEDDEDAGRESDSYSDDESIQNEIDATVKLAKENLELLSQLQRLLPRLNAKPKTQRNVKFLVALMQQVNLSVLTDEQSKQGEPYSTEDLVRL